MELELDEVAPSLQRLALTGRLDAMGVDRIETRLIASLKHGSDYVIDFSNVTFLGSLGIRLLITVAKVLQRRGQKLVLVAPRALVEQALHHSSIDEIIPVAADLDAAMVLLSAR